MRRPALCASGGLLHEAAQRGVGPSARSREWWSFATRPKCRRDRPMLAESGPILDDFGPSPVELGRSRAGHDQIWTGFDRFGADVGQFGPNSASGSTNIDPTSPGSVDLGQAKKPTHPRPTLWPGFGQTRHTTARPMYVPELGPGAAKFGPASTNFDRFRAPTSAAFDQTRPWISTSTKSGPARRKLATHRPTCSRP